MCVGGECGVCMECVWGVECTDEEARDHNVNQKLHYVCDSCSYTTIQYTCMHTYLQHILCGLGSSIILRPPLEVILVLLAVHVLADCLAQQAVPLLAQGTVELVHLIFRIPHS